MERPRGAEQVRAAVLRAARKRFAAEGPSASLRDIAGDADVNLGLLHRHFGSKSALLGAVLDDAVGRGREAFADAHTLDAAIEALLEGVVRQDEDADDYVRVLAWALLTDTEPGQFHAHHPIIPRVAELAGEERRGFVLVAFASILGWHIFGPHLSAVAGYDSQDVAAADLAASLRSIVAAAADTPAGAGRRKRPARPSPSASASNLAGRRPAARIGASPSTRRSGAS